MKTILFATYSSRCSIPAFQFADGLNQKLNTKLVALHVFEVALILRYTFPYYLFQKIGGDP